MKWIKKRSLFLLKEGRSEHITEEEFEELKSKNCTFWDRYKYEAPIYRGLSSYNTYAHVDPKKHLRTSIEPQQIHVAIMSDSKEWSGFPKYEKSIIGSTDYGNASSYGSNIYNIVPYDNARIVFCPKTSIWASFGGFDESAGIKLVSNFLHSIGLYNHDQGDWLRVEDYIRRNKLYPSDVNYTKSKDNLIIRSEYFYSLFMNDLIRKHEEKVVKEYYTDDDVINHILNIFSPDMFTIVNYDENWVEGFKGETEMGFVQIFTDSECLLIEDSIV
jgi:hypothetical protein